MTDRSSIPPGWYPDPTAPGTDRWWDGTTWADHTAPSPGAPGGAPGPAWPGPRGASGPAVQDPGGAPPRPMGVATPPWSSSSSWPVGPPAPPPVVGGGSGGGVAIVVAVVVVGLALLGGLVMLLSRSSPGDDFTSPTRPPAGAEGQDPQLTALAQQCYEGSMEACDDLYRGTPRGSELEDYGDTCGGRMPDPEGRYCADAIDDPILPD